MRFGYARVSSTDQNLDRQIEALKNAGCKKIYQEKISGKNIEDRQELLKLIKTIHEEDIVTVISLDRLSRNSDDIRQLLSQIESKGATFEILDLPTFNGIEDTNLRKLLNNLVIDLMSYTAENERKQIRKRQAEGIAIAKSKGVYQGKQLEYGPHSRSLQKRVIYQQIVNGLNEGKPIAQIARLNDVSRNTVYRIKKRLENNNQN